MNGAQGRSRTGTDFKVRRILSPVRLPISPPGHALFIFKMVTRRRLERLTLWLKVRCSTDWASGSNINWLGYLDSNQGDDRVKVCCLTAWLYPNKMVGRGGFEPPNRKELSYSQPRLATSLPPHYWCRLKDLNPQPTDYKSVALPIELSRQIFCYVL